MRKRRSISIISFILSLTLMLTFWGCGTTVKAEDLMEGITASKVDGKNSDDKFLDSQLNFAIQLLRQNGGATNNTVMSPASVAQALAMVANGADGETLKQIETVLGKGISVEDLNRYYYSFLQNLRSDGTLTSVNSIWFNETIDVNRDFLQKNADYYGADAYASPFDADTAEDINNWVSNKTNGLIPEIIDSIDSSTISVMLNAMYFNAEWEEKYEDTDLKDYQFTSVTGEKQTATYMISHENYISDNKTFEGIMKHYKGKKYAFVAVKAMDRRIDKEPDYTKFITEDLNSEALMKAMKNINDSATTYIPKFKIEYGGSQIEALKKMGITDVFDPEKANLSGISNEPSFISSAVHKAVIDVNEHGTEAAAATQMTDIISSSSGKTKTVAFDCPFIYMIIDTSTFLPVFIGSVTSMN